MKKQVLLKKSFAAMTGLFLLMASIPLPGETVLATADNAAQQEEIHGLGYTPSEQELEILRQIREGRYECEDIEPLVGGGEPLPEAYDPRTIEGTLPAIRYQGAYGTCWVFATVACMEINLIKKNLVDNSIDLSELQLAYASAYSEENPLGGVKDTYFFNNYVSNGEIITFLNDGGNFEISGSTLASGQALTTEENLPYSLASQVESAVISGKRLQSISGYSSYSTYDNNVAQLVNYRYFGKPSVDTIKALINEYGAVMISYNSGETSGDYSYYNKATSAYYCPVASSTNHAVVIVGWDDSFSKDKFKDHTGENGSEESNKPKNDGAWIVRNSWGTTFGEEGYFYLSYEDASMGLAGVFEADLQPENRNMYAYDGTFHSYSGYRVLTNCANVFQASGNEGGKEKITSAAFRVSYLEANPVSYSVKLYTGLTDTKNPYSGTLAASVDGTVSGTVGFTEYHMVDFENPVEVDQGEWFAVVVVLSSAGILPIEAQENASLRPISLIPAAEVGQSLFYYKGAWQTLELSDDPIIPANICIKAFSEDVGGNHNPPSAEQTAKPTASPTASPSASPSTSPSASPSASPTASPTTSPTASPTAKTTTKPTTSPTAKTTTKPTASPTIKPTTSPTSTAPRRTDSPAITIKPTASSTVKPTINPTASPTVKPTIKPTTTPTPTQTPMPKNGWIKENGRWYYYENSVAATSWKKVGGKWYYFNAGGDMVSGWKKVGTKWYYFNAGGDMVTGWKKVGTKWYYFNAGGDMVTGWKKVGTKWYYFNPNGDMVSGWKKLGTKWYYFNAGGDMVSGWKKVGTKWYYFNTGGDMVSGWKKLGGKWYYFKTDGSMAANTTMTIGGKKYSFDKSGAML